MSADYDWKSYRTSAALTGVTPETISQWNHHWEVQRCKMADEMNLSMFTEHPVSAPLAYPKHVRSCSICQERWAKEIMRAHIDSVLDRVTER